MARYKIHESIRDVVNILDSARVGPDLFDVTNYVHLTNRVPIAHLAIERGIKALISDAGNDPKPIHALNQLYRSLETCDNSSAEFLAEAFTDSVKFFGVETKTKGRGHFNSLYDYLSKVGTDQAFEALRYWVIDEPDNRYNPIPFVFEPVHRELLCALISLLGPGRNETVSQRVNTRVDQALWEGWRDVCLHHESVDAHSFVCYQRWLAKKYESSRAALVSAVRFEMDAGRRTPFCHAIRKAYEILLKTEDPAVRYFTVKLTYLPQDSQQCNPDAIAEVEWFDNNQTRGLVKTPAGTCLGYLTKYADGGLGIEPSESGLAQVTEIAEKLADAKHYLVNRLTHQVDVIANGETLKRRIVGERHLLFSSLSDTNFDTPDDFFRPQVYELEFWDGLHGLNVGDTVKISHRKRLTASFVSVLEGNIKMVDEQRVAIIGSHCFEKPRDIP